MILAKEIRLTQVIFESDALTVVQDLQVKEVNGSSGHLYQGIIDLLESFCSWKVCHLKREQNKAAHVLAQFAKCNGTNQVWKGCIPWMIQHIIESERSQSAVSVFAVCCSSITVSMKLYFSLKKKKKKKKKEIDGFQSPRLPRLSNSYFHFDYGHVTFFYTRFRFSFYHLLFCLCFTFKLDLLYFPLIYHKKYSIRKWTWHKYGPG